MDAALLAERTSLDDLRRATGAVHHWRGAGRAARATAHADGRAESPLETRGRLRIVGAIAVEFDGRVKYSDPWRGRAPERVLWEEKRREDEMRALDIRVVRLADADVGSGWPRAERRLRDLPAVPGPAVRRFAATPRGRGVRRIG
jgi:hypothetical protein